MTPLSPEVRTAAIAMATAGETNTAIASKLGAAVRTVQRWRAAAGVPATRILPREMREAIVAMASAGYATGAIAAKLGTSRKNVNKWRAGAGISAEYSPPIDGATKHKALELIASGRTRAEVAELCGISCQALAAWIKAAGMVGKATPGRKAAKPKQTWRRSCLCCGAEFVATSPYLRMCEPCREDA